jgi:DNA repair protein RecO (recombination protein O)
MAGRNKRRKTQIRDRGSGKIMGQSVIVVGMVLTAMPIGEYDKRITILTKERGKITAFARGSRRPASQLLAATNPFSFGEFELFEGRNSYSLSRATIRNYFRELVTDLDAAYLGFYFVEFAEYFCQENNDEKEMLGLLYQSLRALEIPRIPKDLVRVVFELRAITVNGEGPNVFSCMKCGCTDHLEVFSVRRGGLFCAKCAPEVPGMHIRDATRYTLQFILSAPIEKLYTFTVSDEVLAELRQIMKEYMAHYVHHEFKSLAFLT